MQYLQGYTFGKQGLATLTGTSFALGIVGGAALVCLLWASFALPFACFVLCMAAFHFYEFFFVAVYHTADATFDSFMLNQSPQYVTAMSAAVVEYWIELFFFPGAKSFGVVSSVGLVIALGGLLIRLVALFTAKHNFTHEIAETKKENHRLVTDGIYQYIRHPGYMGWFWWAVGSQVLLVNPICTAGFFYASYRFFAERIEYEERKLVKFFPGEYEAYRGKTPTFIPFVK